MAKTPNRTMRIPDRVWIPAQRKAKRIGVPLTRIVNGFLWFWTRDERDRR